MELYVDRTPKRRSHATYFDEKLGKVTCYMVGGVLVECVNGFTFEEAKNNVVLARVSRVRLVAGVASKDSNIGKTVKRIRIFGRTKYGKGGDRRLSEVLRE